MIIEDNFLDNQSFSNLKSLILDTEFPWRLRKQMTDDDNNYYFSYSFFNNNTINSPHYEGHILPILNKLNCNAVVEVRANLMLSDLFSSESGFHTDCSFKCNTAILYLNTCDGGTELILDNQGKKIVESKENRLIMFDSMIKHRSKKSNNSKERYVLNFNYF